MVSGVRVPSEFWRAMEMGSRSRTFSKPSKRKAETTLAGKSLKLERLENEIPKPLDAVRFYGKVPV